MTYFTIFIAMYCNQECLTKARERFHGAYCRSIRPLVEWNEISFLAVTSTWKSLLESVFIVQDPEILQSLMSSNKQTTIFDYDLRNPRREPTADFNHLSIINNLEQSTDKDTEDQRREISSSFVKSSRLREWNRESGGVLVDYSTRLAMIQERNAICLSVGEQRIGSAVLPFASLYNHSCDFASIFVIFIDSKFAHIVLKPIKKGEQLFLNYG